MLRKSKKAKRLKVKLLQHNFKFNLFSNKNFKWQLSLFGVIAVLLFVLTWFGINSSTARFDNPIKEANEPAMEANIHDLLHRFSGSNDEINSLIETVLKDTSNAKNIEALITSGTQNKIDVFNAYGLYLKGILEKDTKILLASAELFFEAGTHDQDSTADKSTYSVYAIRACDIILKTEPKNLDALTCKATSIVYFGGAIMTGVGLLKQVESIDSNFVDAQHHLMILDIQSGQYKKAEKRLKKLLHLQPENQQYADLLLKLETQQIK